MQSCEICGASRRLNSLGECRECSGSIYESLDSELLRGYWVRGGSPEARKLNAEHRAYHRTNRRVA